MRMFELRVYTLRTREALRFCAEQVYPRHLNSLPSSISRPTASGPSRRMANRDCSCRPRMQWEKNRKRSFSGTCKAKGSPRTSGTSICQTS